MHGPAMRSIRIPRGDRVGDPIYDVTPLQLTSPDCDAARLASLVEGLGPEVLLKPVGSFAGQGEDDPIFDLEGNVAEWVVTREGKGKAMGGSADRAADSAAAAEPRAGFTGFRVIHDAR